MRNTKKNQILQLHKAGYGPEEIINKGFSKKYVTQVLKSIDETSLVAIPTSNKTRINDIKQIISILENLDNASNKMDIKINISIKIDSTNTVSEDINVPLLNPIATIRIIGEAGLKEKLKLLQLDDLLKIIKKYTPDISGKINKKKDLSVLISYIVERSSNLSKLGQVFRNENQSE